MNIEMTTITPPMASIMLQNNTENRKLDNRHVQFLADQILSGKWQNNGQTIVIADDGTLMDGQHRLSAIVKANKPTKLGLCTGAPKSAMSTIDNGKLRSTTDILTMNGWPNASLVASGINLLHRFDHNQMLAFHKKPPNAVIMPTVKSMQDKVDLKWLAKIVCKTSLNTRIKKSDLFCAFYLIAVRYGEHCVVEFSDKMNNGGDYSKSPTMVMPQIVARMQAQGRVPHRSYHFTMLLKGFDRWLKREEMNQYRETSVISDIQKYSKKYNTYINW